jgi:hypothetical protein
MTGRHETLKEKVGVEGKMFSVCERHTDIIVKGKKEARFGREAQTSGGQGNLTSLIYEIARGNPKGDEFV